MAFQHVILALLEGGPSHGWQMKVEIEAALGPEYGGLNKGYIYEVIHKMQRDGLIVSRVEAQDGMRPDRSVHEITESGREQLSDWLGEPARRSVGFRDEFVQKVLAASLRGADAVRQVCHVQRRKLLREVKTLETLRRERENDPGAVFAIEVAILRTTAELKCVEAAEARAGQPLIDLSHSAGKPAERDSANGYDLRADRRQRRARGTLPPPRARPHGPALSGPGPGRGRHALWRSGDERHDTGGVGEIGEHRVRAGVAKFSGARAAACHRHRPSPADLGRLHVAR